MSHLTHSEFVWIEITGSLQYKKQDRYSLCLQIILRGYSNGLCNQQLCRGTPFALFRSTSPISISFLVGPQKRKSGGI